MRWIVCLFSLKPIRMLWVCAGAFSCISSTLPQFWNIHTRSHRKTHARTHAHFFIQAHMRAHEDAQSFFLSFIQFLIFTLWDSLLLLRLKRPYWKLQTRVHHNSRITQACVLYRGGGFLQGSLCCPVAKQPRQHWCSCGDSKAMRKGSFKGVDPMLSPPWCQWDKSRQQLMYRGAISVMV